MPCSRTTEERCRNIAKNAPRRAWPTASLQPAPLPARRIEWWHTLRLRFGPIVPYHFAPLIQASARSFIMTVTSRWIDIPANGDTFQGYLALPKGGTGPGVVIIQEIFGVNSHIRAVADQYAADGYVALAPDIFWRVQPRVELGYDGADREKAMEIYGKLDVAHAVADVTATAAALRALPEVTGKVAAVGYCLGAGWRICPPRKVRSISPWPTTAAASRTSSTRPTRSRCRCNSITAHSTRTFRLTPSTRSSSASRTRTLRSTCTRAPITASIARTAHRTIKQHRHWRTAAH